MGTLSRWIIAGVISYGATFWIKNFVWNLIASLVVWYAVLFFLNRWLEGEI